MKKEILTGVELPPVNRPTAFKIKYTEEERRQKSKNSKRLYNSKLTKEQVKINNDKQRAKNTPSYQASLKKAYAKKLISYTEKLEKLAGRPKPLNCEICNSDGKICFDHCHSNHHFRGWICDRCNKVLGLVKDNSAILELLKIYIETDKKPGLSG